MQSPKPKIHDLAILNARVLDVFTGALDTKTVLVEDGLIHGFGSEPAKETFEAKGAVLLPRLERAHREPDALPRQLRLTGSSVRYDDCHRRPS